jgi:hypothetical protein
VGLRSICRAISKRIRRQLLDGAFIVLTSLSRGILIVLEILLLESSPRGRREIIAALRIQTAAKGVNVFVKVMRGQTEL